MRAQLRLFPEFTAQEWAVVLAEMVNRRPENLPNPVSPWDMLEKTARMTAEIERKFLAAPGMEARLRYERAVRLNGSVEIP